MPENDAHCVKRADDHDLLTDVMASRFADVSQDDIDELLERRDSKSTKNVIKGSLSIFDNYCLEKNIDFPTEAGELNSLLKKFYTAVRTKDGSLYTKKSMLSIRYGLQKHFEKTLKVDIVNSPEFKVANNVFNAMLVKLKKEGKASVTHKNPITKNDLRKLYAHFDLDTPYGLQCKVFVDFMIYFCNRGRENLRDITKQDFIFNESDNCISMRDMATKNHKGDVNEDEESQGGRIVRTGKTLCPYTSFKKYISLLHPDCDVFFQRPKKKTTLEDSIWYDNSPVGKNTLGDKMKTLSIEARLSRTYTNHCLRATSITILNECNEARHVMTVSGHKSESSLRHYAKTSEEKRQEMALTIAKAVTGTY